MTTECERSGCHEVATTTVQVLGFLRHVCDVHAGAAPDLPQHIESTVSPKGGETTAVINDVDALERILCYLALDSDEFKNWAENPDCGHHVAMDVLTIAEVGTIPQNPAIARSPGSRSPWRVGCVGRQWEANRSHCLPIVFPRNCGSEARVGHRRSGWSCIAHHSKPLLKTVASGLVQKELRALESAPTHAAFEILDQAEHGTDRRTVQRTLIFRRGQILRFVLATQIDLARQRLASRRF